jgi:hypothetical protein
MGSQENIGCFAKTIGCARNKRVFENDVRRIQ